MSIVTSWCNTSSVICSYSKRNYSAVIWFLIVFKIVALLYVYYTYLSNEVNSRVKYSMINSLPVDFDFKINEEEKLILLWTNFNGYLDFDNFCFHRDIFESSCPQTKCQWTLDKNQLINSDAVVFHEGDIRGPFQINGYDGYLELPKFRSKLQYWIFMAFESPIHTENLRPFDNLFNMTMTYRLDSDIPIPFGKLIPLENQTETKTIESTTSTQKKSLIAWTASNCYNTPSRRSEVVHELSKYITIDIYGDCGDKLCTPKSNNLCYSGLECHQFLSTRYKFYLAFENSLCEGYITEKFYDSLYVGMVPIVYGSGDYSEVAPVGSFIDILSFPNLKALADYLHYLDRNPREYEKYFDWRKRYSITVDYYDDAWCSLCTKIWDSHIHKNTGADVERKILTNLTDWWIHKKPKVKQKENLNLNSRPKESSCTDPTNLNWDTSVFTFFGFFFKIEYRIRVIIIRSIYAVIVGFVAFIVICVLCTVRNKNRSKVSMQI